MVIRILTYVVANTGSSTDRKIPAVVEREGGGISTPIVSVGDVVQQQQQQITPPAPTRDRSKDLRKKGLKRL